MAEPKANFDTSDSPEFREVFFRPGVLPRGVTGRAAATIIRYYASLPGEYNFVEHLGHRSDIYYISMHDMPEPERGRTKSLQLVAKSLSEFAGVSYDEAEEFGVMIDEGGSSELRPHKDKGDFSRALLQLAGTKKVSLTPYSQPQTEAVLSIFEGDLYAMRFHPDREKSILHGVQYIPGLIDEMFNVNISMFLNVDN